MSILHTRLGRRKSICSSTAWGEPSVLGYDLACPRPSEGGDYPGTAWPRAGSRIGRQRYVRRAGAEPERLARQREPYWDRHGRHLPGRRACARDGAARSRRLSRPPGPGRLLARVGADVLPDHHNGIDCTGTGFATGASRPHAKCHRPDWIHAAAFRKTLRARSRFRLELTAVVCRYAYVRLVGEGPCHWPDAERPCDPVDPGGHRPRSQGSPVSATAGQPREGCLPGSDNALVRAQRTLPYVGSARLSDPRHSRCHGSLGIWMMLR